MSYYKDQSRNPLDYYGLRQPLIKQQLMPSNQTITKPTRDISAHHRSHSLSKGQFQLQTGSRLLLQKRVIEMQRQLQECDFERQANIVYNKQFQQLGRLLGDENLQFDEIKGRIEDMILEGPVNGNSVVGQLGIDNLQYKQIAQLKEEISQLNNQLLEQKNMKQQLRQRIERYEGTQFQLRRQNQQLQERLDVLRGQLQSLKSMQLSFDNQKMYQNVSRGSRDGVNQEIELTEVMQKMREKDNLISDKDKQLREKNIYIKELISKMQRTNNKTPSPQDTNIESQFSLKYNDLQSKYQHYLNEYQRLQQRLKEYQLKITQNQLQMQKYQQQIQSELNYSKSQLQQSKRIQSNVQEENSTIKQQLQQYDKRYRQSMERLEESQSKIVEREQRIRQMEEKLKHTENMFKETQDQLKQTQVKIEQYQHQLHQLQTQIQFYKNKLTTYQQTHAQKQAKKFFLQTQLSGKDRLLSTYKQKLQQYQSKINQFNYKSGQSFNEDDLQTKIQYYQSRVNLLQQQIQTLNQQLGQQRQKMREEQIEIIKLQEYIERLNKDIGNYQFKEKEFQRLQKVIKQSETTIQQYQEELVRSREQINQLRKDIESLNAKLKQQLTSLQNPQQQLHQMRQVVEQKNKQLHQSETRLSQLTQSYSQISRLYHSQQQQLQQLTHLYQQLFQRNKKLQEHNQQLIQSLSQTLNYTIAQQGSKQLKNALNTNEGKNNSLIQIIMEESTMNRNTTSSVQKYPISSLQHHSIDDRKSAEFAVNNTLRIDGGQVFTDTTKNGISVSERLQGNRQISFALQRSQITDKQINSNQNNTQYIRNQQIHSSDQSYNQHYQSQHSNQSRQAFTPQLSPSVNEELQKSRHQLYVRIEDGSLGHVRYDPHVIQQHSLSKIAHKETTNYITARKPHTMKQNSPQTNVIVSQPQSLCKESPHLNKPFPRESRSIHQKFNDISVNEQNSNLQQTLNNIHLTNELPPNSKRPSRQLENVMDNHSSEYTLNFSSGQKITSMQKQISFNKQNQHNQETLNNQHLQQQQSLLNNQFINHNISQQHHSTRISNILPMPVIVSSSNLESVKDQGSRQSLSVARQKRDNSSHSGMSQSSRRVSQSPGKVSITYGRESKVIYTTGVRQRKETYSARETLPLVSARQVTESLSMQKTIKPSQLRTSIQSPHYVPNANSIYIPAKSPSMRQSVTSPVISPQGQKITFNSHLRSSIKVAFDNNATIRPISRSQSRETILGVGSRSSVQKNVQNVVKSSRGLSKEQIMRETQVNDQYVPSNKTVSSNKAVFTQVNLAMHQYPQYQNQVSNINTSNNIQMQQPHAFTQSMSPQPSELRKSFISNHLHESALKQSLMKSEVQCCALSPPSYDYKKSNLANSQISKFNIVKQSKISNIPQQSIRQSGVSQHRSSFAERMQQNNDEKNHLLTHSVVQNLNQEDVNNVSFENSEDSGIDVYQKQSNGFNFCQG